MQVFSIGFYTLIDEIRAYNLAVVSEASPQKRLLMMETFNFFSITRLIAFSMQRKKVNTHIHN